MTTPEGKVKDAVKKVLKKHPVYAWWPVPSGYGESSLDCIGCANGYFFGIETKAPGKVPTPRQKECIRRMREANAEVFVIDGDPKQLRELDVWLTTVCYPGR